MLARVLATAGGRSVRCVQQRCTRLGAPSSRYALSGTARADATLLRARDALQVFRGHHAPRLGAAARCSAAAPRSAHFSSAAAGTGQQDAEEVEDVGEDDDEDDDDDDAEEEDEVVETASSVSDADGVGVVVRRKNIRCSWKKLNFLTRLVQGRYALDALAQMAYTKKRKGIDMRNLINLGAVRALQDHDIPIERLVIERAIVNKGPIAKRMRFHARGRVGKNYHRYSHLRLEFREVPEQAPRAPLADGQTRSRSWTQKPPQAKEGRGKAARRAANAAANAEALGARLSQ